MIQVIWNDLNVDLKVWSYLCFIWTISSLLSPLILSCLLRSLTERVTRSSSVIPHCTVYYLEGHVVIIQSVNDLFLLKS